eukprot:TRINITY_DN2077_c0_g1_i1.p1 TRINITY_DN2077_c0_g1~~TRINITY_DN2077_c0_g1_i1.p1  ORF type:complete len:354 (-),score=138.25 TRINITY_DN2077_c0_g1_i1:71-1132(-)
MGNVCASGGGKKENDEKNKEITIMLREEKKRLDSEVKLLLLGAGESGKSTIAKQMKIIHLSGFTKEECLTYKSIIYNNVIGSMKMLIHAANEKGLPINQRAIADKFVNDPNYFTGYITKTIASDVKALWTDPGIQKAYQRQSEFQLNDSAKYYFECIDRLASEDYVPTEQDVLRSRAKTTGIIETEFVVEKTHFKMVDVGGQRSERKKWMHCFQDVTAVIFCVALSEYDLKLYEDNETNRMFESLKLFKEICNSRWFIDTSMILFLNKKDVFEEKIKKTDLKVTFEEYTGGKDFDNAVAFIKDRFLQQNENPKKYIYTHVTCATDTGNIQVVFNAVKDIILHKVLNDSGFGVN